MTEIKKKNNQGQERFRRPFYSKGIFSQKAAVSRTELKKIFPKRYVVPGGRGEVYTKESIKKMFGKDFPRERFGSNISRKEVKKRLLELRMEKYKARTKAEKLNLSQKISFYRKKFF
jgi:hypothetical protein